MFWLLAILSLAADPSPAAARAPVDVSKCNARFRNSPEIAVRCEFWLREGRAAGPFVIPEGSTWEVEGDDAFHVKLFDRAGRVFYEDSYKKFVRTRRGASGIVGQLFVWTRRSREDIPFALEVRRSRPRLGGGRQPEVVRIEREPVPAPTGMPGGWKGTRIYPIPPSCADKVVCARKLRKPCDGGGWPVRCTFMLEKGKGVAGHDLPQIPAGSWEVSGENLYVRIRKREPPRDILYEGPMKNGLPFEEYFWITTPEREPTEVLYEVFPPTDADGRPTIPPRQSAGMELLGLYVGAILLGGLAIWIFKEDDDRPQEGTARWRISFAAWALLAIVVLGFPGCFTYGDPQGTAGGAPRRLLFGFWLLLRYGAIPFALIAATHPNGATRVTRRIYEALSRRAAGRRSSIDH